MLCTHVISWDAHTVKAKSIHRCLFAKYRKYSFFLCRTVHVCIHKGGTCVLLSLNIAVFLALLLLLEDQSAVTSSAGTKGNDHLDTAMPMTILRARTLPAELAPSK